MPGATQHMYSGNDQNIKLFYCSFKNQRATFLSQIQPCHTTISEDEREHYATLMLNRLMFLYFIQKKGFLAGDTDYLSTHLHFMQAQRGPDTFYADFLLKLFHEGLSQPQPAPEYATLLGDVPYLASSLFRKRQVEDYPLTFQIHDEGFRQIFAFFDTYQWHLDERLALHEHEITPETLGYIFEQFVNQQQMGAYYTREDITTYIAKNTIIPSLFDTVARICPSVFQPEGGIWQLLQQNPDAYISEAIRRESPLPGETLREYHIRYEYYKHVYKKISSGQISCIDDLITYNLDSTRFTCDVLQRVENPEHLYTFFACMQRMTILDPTCGSGAFLFAALNVLMPLYETCLQRLATLPHCAGIADTTLAQMQAQSNRTYAIVKTIVSNNLYGIDIMETATEICKLRLFLKLLAQLERIQDIEALPDIEQHILSGNTLNAIPRPESTKSHMSSETLPDNPPLEASASWYYAFSTILQAGGFDVIIGNPPYVEYNEQAFSYKLRNFITLPSRNLYPCIVERCRQLLAPTGRQGMILPLAAFATRNMLPLIEGFRRWFPQSWLSFYHFRPSMLFSGGKAASIPTAIYLAKAHGVEQRFSTGLIKWSQEQRCLLFSRLTYCQITARCDPENRHYYPKFGHALENTIMEKILLQQKVSQYLSPVQNDNTMFYRSAGGLYWKIFVNFAWPYKSTSNKRCSFQQEYARDVFVALFNSSLFWWYYTVTFDTFNVKDYMLFGFRFSYPEDIALRRTLQNHCQLLMEDFQRHAKHLTRSTSASYTIYARKSKSIIDEIDRTLAQHYGFSAEELDFIIAYDLKYRSRLERE